MKGLRATLRLGSSSGRSTAPYQPSCPRWEISSRRSKVESERGASIAASSFLGLLLLLLDAADSLELQLFACERPLIILVIFLLIIRVIFDSARELDGKLCATCWPWLWLSRLLVVTLLLLRRIVHVQNFA